MATMLVAYSFEEYFTAGDHVEPFDPVKVSEGDALAVVVQLLDHLDATEIDILQRQELPRVRMQAANDVRRVRPVVLPMRAKL